MLKMAKKFIRCLITNEVDMSKIDHLLMHKSSFFQLEKKKGTNVDLAGLIFTEDESISGWANRTEQVIKVRTPNNFDELEKFDRGHLLEYFHNLDIPVIRNQVLHHSALLIFKPI